MVKIIMTTTRKVPDDKLEDYYQYLERLYARGFAAVNVAELRRSQHSIVRDNEGDWGEVVTETRVIL